LADSEKEVIRENNGRFVKGKSGNPKGRPLGAKNRITKAKQELEALLREDIVRPKDIRDVWNALLDEAKAGNVSAAKIILDKTISQATGSDDEVKEGGGFTIKVKNLTIAGAEPEEAPLEGEYEEV